MHSPKKRPPHSVDDTLSPSCPCKVEQTIHLAETSCEDMYISMSSSQLAREKLGRQVARISTLSVEQFVNSALEARARASSALVPFCATPGASARIRSFGPLRQMLGQERSRRVPRVQMEGLEILHKHILL
ncbi:unnamed protein product [Peniophora sp. CBMAI 1063]|nr:unnamed protein product [Peniophora sp. CBMAI 1063]